MATFRQINPKNFAHIMPTWALGASAHAVSSVLDEQFQDFARQRGVKFLKGREMTFWCELNSRTNDLDFRIAEPDGGIGDANAGWFIIDAHSPMGGECQVHIPLYSILKGFPDLRSLHSLYLHSMQGDGKVLNYCGITKQRWFDRLSQHVSSARSGSRLVFHEAIRRNNGAEKIHRVIVAGCNYETAMAEEESWVDEFSLYPLGLNMIPGGFAGMAYLGKLGFRPSSAKERDDVVETIAQRETIGGQPNPLCAARWASDQDFVNRIICGHGNRLSVDQVLSIRRLSDFGKSAADISGRLSIPLDRRLKEIISGARYARVA